VSEEPTTPDPVESLRRSFEAGNRGDLDGAVAVFSHVGAWDMSQLGIGVFSGHDAIRVAFEDWLVALDDTEIGLEEIHDLGNGVTFGVAVQRGKPTGVARFVTFRYPAVWTWADGLIQRATNYLDVDEARAAAERLAQERG
jgi:ketosteroid isomerase-like protein